MIHTIYSTLPKFKRLSLKPGLNMLLADKSPGATDLQTRNRAGKTSLVELIHFLLGSNCDPKSIFRDSHLTEHTFGMTFDLVDAQTTVERSGKKPSKINVSTESVDDTLETLKSFGWDGTHISNVKWRQVLGSLMFGLRGQQDEEDDDGKGGPTYRSLFAYFARRQESGGFTSPIKNSSIQQIGDYQVAISYLLGLDWTIAQRWQVVRAREKALKTLKTEAEKGTFGSVIGTTAELRTQLIVATERARRLRENVNAFQVLPEYRSFEAEATEAVKRLNELADQNTLDRQLIDELEKSFAVEKPPALPELEQLYREAGVILPDSVNRRFDDVRRFHDSVVQNRKSYLQGELTSAYKRIEERDAEKQRLGDRYQQVMGVLKSHGALDQFSQLQSELARQDTQVAALSERYVSAQQIEGEKTELDIERDRLLLRLQQDFAEQEEVLRHAIVSFEEMSSSLYEKAGSLTIDASRNGPQFEVKMHGDKSKGITNMQIFCFDMMIMKLCSERGMGPKFLVHDSHLFDGVDERQAGRALQVGALAAERYGFQYIVTYNSDALPKELPRDFDLESFILPVRLTDASDEGGLFGLRFG